MNWYDMTFGGEERRPPDDFYADEDELFGMSIFDLVTGRAIDSWNHASVLRSSSPEYDKRPQDVLNNAIVVPVFSRRLLDLLGAARVGVGDIQYLPIQVFRSTGEELPNYSVANIVARISALDREHSTMLDVYDDRIDPLTQLPKVAGIWTAALKARCIEGHDIIRLLEYFPPIFVSERFVDVFRQGNCTGATFSEVPVI